MVVTRKPWTGDPAVCSARSRATSGYSASSCRLPAGRQADQQVPQARMERHLRDGGAADHQLQMQLVIWLQVVVCGMIGCVSSALRHPIKGKISCRSSARDAFASRCADATTARGTLHSGSSMT